MALLSLPAAMAMAQGQLGASPLAPGTLRKPLFDTITPVYDTNRNKEQGSNTVVAEVDGRTVMLGNVIARLRD